jgi:lipopolysaccharide export LptBFGC system permease protein LptF
MILGGILSAFISVVVALLTSRVQNAWLRFAIVGAFAYVCSHGIFSAWVWLGSQDPQTSSWSPIFINAWFVSGLVSGGAAVLISSLLKKSNNPSHGS